MQLKMGGKFHLRLNNGKRPIANKYREGKMKSTLKRELKAREIVKRETIEASSGMESSAVPTEHCRDESANVPLVVCASGLSCILSWLVRVDSDRRKRTWESGQHLCRLYRPS